MVLCESSLWKPPGDPELEKSYLSEPIKCPKLIMLAMTICKYVSYFLLLWTEWSSWCFHCLSICQFLGSSSTRQSKYQNPMYIWFKANKSISTNSILHKENTYLWQHKSILLLYSQSHHPSHDNDPLGTAACQCQSSIGQRNWSNH